jgi:hypothetical protein
MNIIRNIKSAEKLMSAGRSKGTLIDDMGSISRAAASIYYQAAAIDYLINSERTQSGVRQRIFGQINKDFGNYVDMQARSYTSRLHHVYEWKRPGDPASRLWKLNAKYGEGYNMSISYSFKQSRVAVPNDNSSLKKYVFHEKARIMEFRIPVTIKPRTARGRLAFRNSDNKLIVLPEGRSVNVKMPGGRNAFQGFARTHERFFKGPMLMESIDRSGVQKAMSRASKSVTKVPTTISSKIMFTSINPSSVRRMAKSKAESEGARI